MDNLSGIRFGPEIQAAARGAGIDSRLLAAVAAQETGGPGSDSGSNIVGDGGHGHGVFQLDDRYHAIARTPAAMDLATNANYAAQMISGLLHQYGGDQHAALSAYNTGSPTATGTQTTWPDGQRLGYADSVQRHLSRLQARDALLPDSSDPSAPAAALTQLAGSSSATATGGATATSGATATGGATAAGMAQAPQIPTDTSSTPPFRSYSSEYRDAAGSVADQDDRLMSSLIDPSDTSSGDQSGA
jgi:hypothetical protein